MTAIAYKDGILATDSLIVGDGAYRLHNEEKAFVYKSERGTYIFTGAGEFPSIKKYCAQFGEALALEKSNPQAGFRAGFGFSAAEPPAEEEIIFEIEKTLQHGLDNSSAVICILPSGDYLLLGESGVIGPYPKSQPTAEGCAGFIFGCLDSGKSAAIAVHLACDRYITCGGPVNIYKAGVGKINK